jgi:hypothetical protein
MKKISVVAMLVVVILIGDWVDDLSCRTIDVPVLMNHLSNARRHLVPAILSETVMPGSCRDKWLIHFRLHV